MGRCLTTSTLTPLTRLKTRPEPRCSPPAHSGLQPLFSVPAMRPQLTLSPRRKLGNGSFHKLVATDGWEASLTPTTGIKKAVTAQRDSHSSLCLRLRTVIGTQLRRATTSCEQPANSSRWRPITRWLSPPHTLVYCPPNLSRAAYTPLLSLLLFGHS